MAQYSFFFPEERKKLSSLHRYNKIEMMPAMGKDIHFGSSIGGAGGTNTANGGNGGSIGAPAPRADSCAKPQQELPSLTHQYAEQYVYAYPAPPAYGGPPKPPPAYRYGYGYGGGGSGGYGYGYSCPEPDGIWDEPAGAYGGGRYHPPQPPYYHGGGRGGYPSPQFGRGAGAGGYYSYHAGGGGGGGCGYPPAAGGGGGGGHGVSNAYGGPPQQKPHVSAGWLAAGAATAYGAYQHHMRKHHGGGGHGYRHGQGGGYDDGCSCGGDGYGYGCRGCAPHMHMRGEFEHQESTNIKYSAHHDGKCNDAASGPPVTVLDKCASQPTSGV
ncbi:hypothetical protein CFC21_107994 [Triticum aestivum]|uniref:Uncharacterized protein n=5 Tax=Triticum aestivum TaxID=4565 RepID=A0A9R1MH92_WHEAT|nr:hypothetical protein CFC21_107994 [Triticum aestivum]